MYIQLSCTHLAGIQLGCNMAKNMGLHVRITCRMVLRLLGRLAPIMLLKLPIMLWSNAPIFFLLCSNYAP